MARILTVTLNPALDIATGTARVVPGVKLRCAAPRQEPGGGGVNVSRALAILGTASTAFVALGGATGQRHRALLEAGGILPVVFPVEGETRESLVVAEEESGRLWRFMLPGPRWPDGAAARVLEAIGRLMVPGAGGGIVVLSGSLPPGLPASLPARLAQAAGGRGWRAVLDVSGPALRRAAAGGGAHVLRMNGDEAATLAGTAPADPAAAAAFASRLVARGSARVVSVSLGAAGAVAVSAGEAWHAAAPPGRPVSAVGAGDSFVAGLVLGLARGEGLDRCLARAVAAAASAVTTPGSALCTREGTAAMRAAIVPRRLDPPRAD